MAEHSLDEPTVDVVQTHAEAGALSLPPLVVLDGLEDLIPGQGPIHVERLGTGHSNETFKVERDGVGWALRRPPRPPIPPSAHDVIREYRVLCALSDQNVKIPKPFKVCTDAKVIGAPFYLMELVPGWVVREKMPAEHDTPAERRRVVELFVDTLVDIHAVEWRDTDLASIGRPDGYLERQLRRWKSQWEHNKTRELEGVTAIGDWLTEHMPADHETTVVHGDYKLDNAIFSNGSGIRLVAIVDWEMATLGDPLADVGLLCATYLNPGETPDPVLGFSPATTAPGSLTRAEIRSRYAEGTGRDLGLISWYEVLALWKIAILLQGSYKRYLAGTTNDQFFARLEDGIPRVVGLIQDRIANSGI